MIEEAAVFEEVLEDDLDFGAHGFEPEPPVEPVPDEATGAILTPADVGTLPPLPAEDEGGVTGAFEAMPDLAPAPAPVVRAEATPAFEPEPLPVFEPEPVPFEPEPLPVVEPEPTPAFEPEPMPAFEPEPAPVFEREPAPVFEPKPRPPFEPEPEPVFEPEPAPVFEPEPAPVFEPKPRPPFEPEPEQVFEPEPAPVFEPEPAPVFEPEPAPVFEPDPSRCSNRSPSRRSSRRRWRPSKRSRGRHSWNTFRLPRSRRCPRRPSGDARPRAGVVRRRGGRGDCAGPAPSASVRGGGPVGAGRDGREDRPAGGRADLREGRARDRLGGHPGFAEALIKQEIERLKAELQKI